MRLKNEAVSTCDLYMWDPRRLREEPGWNARTNTPELRAHLDGLKASIAINGVLEPLTAYQSNEEVVVTNGHCRLRAVMELIAEGHEILSVPVRVEDKTANEADRCLSMITRNSGLPLTPIEKGEVFRRLVAFGWDPARIAERSGISVTYVNQCMGYLALPEQVKAKVEQGQVSAPLAAEVARQEGPRAAEVLQEAQAIAEAGGKAKVTPKHVAQAKEALKPSEPLEGDPAPDTSRKRVDWNKVGPKLRKHLQAIFNATPDELPAVISKAALFEESI